ncbi:hypothetical protein AB1N83_003653 [Pleurotus pulmonarius]
MAQNTPFIPDLTGNVTKQDVYPAAHGGFADIWMCTLVASPSPSNIKVAVKVLRSLGSDDMSKYEKRLRRELMVWLRLKHPQVLPLYGVVSDFGPYPSMVCPWMDKGNLNNYLSGEGKSLDVEGRYMILRQVCDGLAYLHSCSVVHGDLTGCNVLINGNGDACLSDFGLSAIISDLQGVSTLTSSIAGNVRFAAPELFEVGDDDARIFPTTNSDIYSLGSIILQTLTGNIPYHYIKTDGRVLIELSRGIHPRRPKDTIVTDSRWRLLRACWQTRPLARPKLEDVVEYIRDPDRMIRPKPSPLPHLSDIYLGKLFSLSHRGKMESWTAQRNGANLVVKIFRFPWSTKDKDRALQEIRNFGEVQHEHILPYLATIENEGFPGVAMPWVSNHNLCKHIRTLVVPTSRRFTLLQKVANGLLYLHSMSIVHGGLTGWNILVANDGEVKLTNFGIMPILYRHTQSSKMLETYDEDCRWADPILWFGYTDDEIRAPETFATDVYAFGRVVYQMMTTKLPFHDLWDSPTTLRTVIIH